MVDDASSGTRSHLPISRNVKRALAFILSLIVAYVVIAYLLVPGLWSRYAKRHPALDSLPDITQTHDHHPGDPINVALIGSKDDLNGIMHAAGWFPADPLGLKSDVKIAADTVLDRPYA